jgi:hypothetical protein
MRCAFVDMREKTVKNISDRGKIFDERSIAF